MAWVRECPKCGKQRVYNQHTGTCYGCAPAQEEKEMQFECRCKKCDREHNAPSWDTKYCRECAKQATADLRERWDRAFYAALTGLCSKAGCGTWEHMCEDAENIASASIRRGTASRDKLIAEVVG